MLTARPTVQLVTLHVVAAHKLHSFSTDGVRWDRCRREADCVQSWWSKLCQKSFEKNTEQYNRTKLTIHLENDINKLSGDTQRS